jgi:hypothetical protein
VSDLPAFSNADEIAIVERWAKAIATAAPARTETLRQLIPIWRLQAPRSRQSVTIHRDFYSRQVLCGVNRTTLLDLDTLSGGDAAVDVGNLLAHAWLESLQHTGEFAAGQFEQASRETLAAYRSSGGRLLQRNLRWYLASALLRLGAVHALRTTTGRFSGALWGLAARLIDATGVVGEQIRVGGVDGGPHPDVEAILCEARE